MNIVRTENLAKKSHTQKKKSALFIEEKRMMQNGFMSDKKQKMLTGAGSIGMNFDEAS